MARYRDNRDARYFSVVVNESDAPGAQRCRPQETV